MNDPYTPQDRSTQAPKRAEVELRKGAIFFVFLLALVAGALGDLTEMVHAALWGTLGYALAAALDLLWGDRTRPKNTPLWWVLGIAWAAVLLYISWGGGSFSWEVRFVPPHLAFVIGLFLRHDQGITPTLFIAGAVWAAVFVGDRWMPSSDQAPLGEAEAVWIALTVLFGIIAATLEHERLLRRSGAGTPVPWTVLRLGFVSVWTLVVLSLREDVQWGRLFVWLGADLTGQAGQMFLIGVIVIAVVVAAFAFRPGKEPPQET